MKTNDEMNLLLDRICMNCNYFFPYLLYGQSEYGVCLNDSEFEPYITVLLEDQNYDYCIELIEEKKFDGNCDCCKDFEMIEIVAQDSARDELFGIDLNDEQQVTELLNFALNNKSVDEYREKLESPNPETRLDAFENLSARMCHDNNEALELFIESFEKIPPPVTLEDVHFKLKVFRFLNTNKYVKELIPILIRDLHETKSNNSTRQWISEIFRFLDSKKNEERVTENLERMLEEKQFSYRIKNKIKDILREDDFHV